MAESAIPEEFFTLPAKILEWVQQLREGSQDADWQMELEFSARVRQARGSIGIRGPVQIIFPLLAPLDSVSAMIEWAAQDPDPRLDWVRQSARAASIADERLARIHHGLRAYAGWLVVNRTFLDERQALFQRWGRFISGFGVERTSLIGPEHVGVDGMERASDEVSEFQQACKAFLSRWRLQRLVERLVESPPLPDPIGPGLQALHVPTIAARMGEGALLFLPDTFPVPDRATLRAIAEESIGRASERPAHLAEWQEVMFGERSRRRVERFERLFRVAWVWSLLLARHREVLSGNRERFFQATAELTFILDGADPPHSSTRNEQIAEDIRSLERFWRGEQVTF